MSYESSPIDIAEVLEQLRDSVRGRQEQRPADTVSPGIESPSWGRWKPLVGKLEQSRRVNPHLPIAWPEWPRGIWPKAVALVQKVTRRLLRWYINPIVEQQNTFNQTVTMAFDELVTQINQGIGHSKWLEDRQVAHQQAVTGALNELVAQVGEAMGHSKWLEEQHNAVYQTLSRLATQVDLAVAHGNRLEDETRMIATRMEQAEDETRMIATRTGVLSQRLRRLEQSGPVPPSATSGGDAEKTRPAAGSAASDGLDYFMLELKYRGAPELIKERQAAYLPDFSGRRAVLDIGCGRGEFVELLRENGVDARGIDLDPDAVAYCQERGLPVVEAEAVDYLRGLEDGALDGIFMAQVAEHLTPATLQALLSLAFAKLEPGGLLVAETVNPLCVYALVNHYLIDPSHVRPIHPELFKFMAESAGFGRTRIRYQSPTPETIRLQHQALPPDAPAEEVERIALMNENTAKLNNLLFGYQDYAIVATRLPGDLALQESREGNDA